MAIGKTWNIENDFCKSPVNNTDRWRALFYNFYTFIKVEYQQNNDVINNVIDTFCALFCQNNCL